MIPDPAAKADLREHDSFLQADMDNYDMLDMMNEARRELGQRLQRTAAAHLEAALVQYPFRGAASWGPSPAILAQPLLLDQDRSIAEIKDLAVSPTPCSLSSASV
jgi:hypothetical protein